MALNLYKISQRQQDIERLLEENEGLLTPEIEDLFAKNEQDFVDSAEGSIALMLKLEHDIDNVDKELKRIQNIKKVKENALRNFKESFLNILKRFRNADKNGVWRYETDTYRVSTRKSESVEIIDADKIPLEFCEQKSQITILKSKIAEKLKAGEEIEGVLLKTNHTLHIK